MCSLEILEEMSKVTGMILNLQVSSIIAFGDKVSSDLRYIPDSGGQEARQDSFVMSGSDCSKLVDAFRKTLHIIAAGGEDCYDSCYSYMESLKNVVFSYPSFRKLQMDGETRADYKKALEAIEGRISLTDALVSCRNAIYQV